MSSGELFLTDNLKDSSWRLVERQTASTARGGIDQVVTLGRPYWVASFQYRGLRDAQLRALSAWLARRDGGRVTFTAYRPSRKAPASNPNADNSGISIAIDTNPEALLISSVAGKVPQSGDMVGYYTANNGYFLGECVESLFTGAASTRQIVRPTPVPVNTSTPNPRIVQALAEMRLDPQSVSISEPHGIGRAAVSFEAVQVVR